MKKALKVIGIILGVVVLLSGGMLYLMTKDIPTLKKLEIDPVEVSKLADGTYEGKYEWSRWNSEVQVQVKDGKITDIKLLSQPLVPDASDQLFDRVIENQDVTVDTVTGATATSKAYLKSIENALSDNQQK